MKRFQLLVAIGIAGLIAAAALFPPTAAQPGSSSAASAPGGAAVSDAVAQDGAHASDRQSRAPADVAPAAPTPRGKSSSCTGTITRTASPATILDCEQAAVNVQFDTACSVCPGGINVVFIELTHADDYAWMRESAYRAMDELTRFQQRMKNPIPIRVGVVQYNNLYGITKVRLTEWLMSARGALGQVQSSGGSPSHFQGRLDQAVGAARSMLRDEHRRQNLGDDDRLCDYAVIYAMGSLEYPIHGQRMVSAARALIGDGVNVMVGCPSSDPASCFYPQLMPRSRRQYATPPDRSAFSRMLQWDFREYDAPYTLRELGLTQVLTPSLTYIGGSASIAPDAVVTSTAGTTLTWQWTQLETRGAHSVTYGVAPLELGELPVRGDVSLWDADGRRGSFPMPSLPISVTGLCATPTPTPTNTPTPTDTPTPTNTPTPTATPTSTPTPTATPTPAPGYLPVAMRESCSPKQRQADVVLVLDVSSSMTEAKLGAAKAAAKAFVGALNLPSDRAAVVAFSYYASVAIPLGADVDALDRAIDALSTAAGTRIDRGLDLANELLEAPDRSRNRTGVIVLLTDGIQTDTQDAPHQQADRARRAGFIVYVIGLGADVDGATLVLIAGDAKRYHYAPTPDELIGIYEQVASDIPCPPSAFWGRR